MRYIISLLMAILVVSVVFTGAVVQVTAQTSQRPGLTGASDTMLLSFYSRFQTLGFLQNLDDDFRNSTRVYLYLKQARLGAKAVYKDIDFHIQLAFGGEEEVRAPSPGVALSLLDLSADIPLSEDMSIRVGQFKVPHSRENIVEEGYLQFTDQSIQDLAFKQGRDVGLALQMYSNSFAGVLGVFTGGGRDVPIRYIPLDLGFPLVVARLGVNEGLDEDLFDVRQTSYESRLGYAFFVNALYIKDSKIGHSTVLNVKLVDKSLLLNSNWNPFINRRPLDKGDVWNIGADAAISLRGRERGVSAEAEINYGSFSNVYGDISLLGGRAFAAYWVNPIQIALRYAFLRPDDSFASVNDEGVQFNFIDTKLIHEITPHLSYFLHGDRVRLMAELPVFIDAPVLTERNIGAYPLLQQPDQARLASNAAIASVSRQTIVEARMQLQVWF